LILRIIQIKIKKIFARLNHSALSLGSVIEIDYSFFYMFCLFQFKIKIAFLFYCGTHADTFTCSVGNHTAAPVKVIHMTITPFPGLMTGF